jgi:hypothetical protein
MIDLNAEWRSIPDWPEYEISEVGHVRRTLGGKGARVDRHLKPWRNPQNGYFYVHLWRGNRRKGIPIHRLVATAFLGSPPTDRHVVAHCDGSRDSNQPWNLRWATQRENMADTFQHGTHNRGSRNGQAKLDEVCVLAIRKMHAMGIPRREAAIGFGVSRKAVDDIISRKRWRHTQ